MLTTEDYAEFSLYYAKQVRAFLITNVDGDRIPTMMVSEGGGLCVVQRPCQKSAFRFAAPPDLAHENPPFFCPAIAKKKAGKASAFFSRRGKKIMI
jgi:hypothetical protein